MTAYDNQNIFAKILRGEVPCQTIYEDQHTLSFMDVMPQADGHVLVIPKNPARTLLDADPSDIAVTFVTVQKIARAVKEAMGADGITLQQFNEAAGGQSVFHWHVHILPRWHGIPLRPHTGQMAPREELAATAQKIRNVLGG